MGIPGNADLLLLKTAAAAGGYQVSRSLRFNGSVDNSYLSRTPASAGNRKTWTWSGWVKRTKIGAGINSSFFRAAAAGQIWFKAGFQDDTISVSVVAGGAEGPKTSAVFRDTSAWYHIVIAFDTTQATAANRQKLYVNGVQVSFTTDLVWPNQNQDYQVNNTVIHYISDPAGGEYFDGYLADVWFVDGSALTPSDFAETDATTGQWIPKTYTGSKGTNGFHLEFADNSNNTATTLGKDTSGNSNNWTPNNFSVTAGAGNDSLVDTPTSFGTDTGAGGEVRGNYCTWNPLGAGTNIALSNGNLDATSNANDWRQIKGTIGVTSGKWYWECTNTGTAGTFNQYHGISNDLERPATNLGTISGYCYGHGGDKYAAGVNTSGAGASYGTNDVIGMALDLDSGTQTIKFYKNGTLQFTQTISGSAPWYPASNCYYSQTGPIFVSNFGQRAFAYTAPSGFKALVDTNLTAPVVAKPNEVMDVLLYTGNGTNGQAITGLNFSPEFVWIKKRSAAAGHGLWDVIRGASNTLSTVNTQTEAVNSVYGKLQSFDGNGFTVTAGTDPSDPRDIVNVNGATYVAWCWDAGTSTVTNTQGSISSQVRANASAGFSIVSYNSGSSTGNFTLGHGLNVAPKFIIHKSRSTSNWWVYHASVVDDLKKYMQLNSTNAIATNSNNMWGGAFPTSSVFGVTVGDLIATSQDAIAYVFSPVAGYSSMGSYVGNGSSDGVFVYTGHRIRFLLIKNTTLGGSNWRIIDTARNPYNVANLLLNPNSSNAEQTTTLNTIDLLSNGFKCRGTDGDTNSSGDTFIYYAVAENPFQYARAR